MDINKNTTTAEVLESFVTAFPYLKLVFYKKSHDHFHGSKKKDEIKEVVTLISLNADLAKGKVEFEDDMSVDNLETYMEESFGLHVQVFRKSGDIWLQTSKTDHWTLNEQNRNGAENEKFATK
jgi:hypothetical protein